MRRLLAIAILTDLSLSDTWAQSAGATVGGSITDVTGALIPAVTVTATNAETAVSTTTLTNETGVYNFPALQPGRYKLTASRVGFLHQVSDLTVSGQHRINFTLPLGFAPTAEVTVMTMDGQMASSSASAGFVLSDTLVRQLPQVGNDVLSLLRMLPGVSVDGSGNSGMSMSSVLTFAGVPQISVNTTRDGVSVTDSRWNTGANANTLVN